MKKTENFSIKLVIVLVITVFTLVAIIYLVQKDWSRKEAVVCGNGVVEGDEWCDGDAWREDVYGMCDPNKYINRCGANCQPECIPKEDLVDAMKGFEKNMDEMELEEDEEMPMEEEPDLLAVCGNGIIEAGEQCDGDNFLEPGQLEVDRLPLCGCRPELETVYDCTGTCQQTCHCE